MTFIFIIAFMIAWFLLLLLCFGVQKYFASGNGFCTFSLFQIKFYTTKLNKYFHRVSSIQWFPWHWWFVIGTFCTLIVSVLAVIILCLMIFNTLSSKPVEQQLLIPVMPGVNLPISQIGYYFLALLIAGIFHEFGHAIAAIKENVSVHGFGIFIMLIYPGAFVDLNTHDLFTLTPIRQLRIYCAGVWHNIIIVIFSILCLRNMHLFLYLCGYTWGNGLCVISAKDAVAGPTGLQIGSTVNRINTLTLTSVDHWDQILSNLAHREKESGFCTSNAFKQFASQSKKVEFVSTISGGYMECCYNVTATHMCFYSIQESDINKEYYCLPARQVTEEEYCFYNHQCQTGYTCTFPSIDNVTRLVRLYHSTQQKPLIFLGDIQTLYYSVTLSNYCPQYFFQSVNFPTICETFLKYLMSLSGALALLNAVPCYALDGQWILSAFLDMYLKVFISSKLIQNFISQFLMAFGTLLILVNVVLAIYSLVFSM